MNPTMRRTVWACAWMAASASLALAGVEEAWTPIFDGKTMTGWHVSRTTSHGTGGKWEIVDGAITGIQDPPGNGGIFITDAQYGDIEVSLEMNNDYGPDSGLFLRSTEKGNAYQALIDYYPDGNLMGIYGEAIGGFDALNYRFLGSPDKIKLQEYQRWPCPLTPEEWAKFWKHGEWHELRARIEGNPPRMQTWIQGVKFMDWTDKEKRLDDKGGIALQVHGGKNMADKHVRYRNIRVRRVNVPDNKLTDAEKQAGWKLLFDGKTLDGWTTDKLEASQTPVEDGCLNPHGCGGYMMVPKGKYGDFLLSLDFKISKGCNSGIFLRTFSLEPKPGWDVGFNGLEVQVLDSQGKDYHDTGAIYDLVKPARNTMQPAGEWNHALIRCEKNLVTVEINGDLVTRMDLDEFTEPSKRPDGSVHKFTGIAYKDFPREGYIGLQDHGSPCWYKNIKLLPLGKSE